MKFTTNQSEFYNDMADVIRLFFGMERISPEDDGDTVLTHWFSEADGQWTHRCGFAAPGEPPVFLEETHPAADWAVSLLTARLNKRYAKLCLYHLLKQRCQAALPWGSLTGIRPTKLARQLMAEETFECGVAEALTRVFDVSPAKAQLVADILEAQRGIYEYGNRVDYDVYLGIPFCRTRCLYCSFFSSDLRKPRLVAAYVEALLAEIEAMGRFLAERGRRCRAVYVGGGTPTSIETAQLERIIEAAQRAFPGAAEWTVEAGRPDCAPEETLAMLHAQGVGRISINPQTMNDRTLQAIGRGHSAADVLRAYESARRAGIAQINMDLIVGLPGEGVEDVRATLRALEPLDMDNLTVHTLAVKHSSRLNERLEEYPLPSGEQAVEMLDLTHAFARGRGMLPYYMYRQKYMRGNLENVGFAMPGTQCVYNIDMMEETHDIVALGAGAVSKRMFFEQTRHERFPNPKNIEYYIQSIDSLIRGKIQFYSKQA